METEVTIRVDLGKSYKGHHRGRSELMSKSRELCLKDFRETGKGTIGLNEGREVLELGFDGRGLSKDGAH